MEKEGTAGKATVVTGIPCRQGGLKPRTAEPAPALPRDEQWYREPRSETSLPMKAPGVTCSFTKLCQGHCRCAGSTCRCAGSPCRCAGSQPCAHLRDGRKREEEHAQDGSLLHRDKGLQNPWHAESRIYMEVSKGTVGMVTLTQLCAGAPKGRREAKGDQGAHG